jgi:chloride channel protein, CIC family
MVALFKKFERYPLFSFFLHSRFTSSVFLAVIVGVGTGFGVVGFVKLIDFFKLIFFDGGKTFLFFLRDYYVILIPVLGALLVGPLVWLVPEAKGHGVPEVMKSIAIRGGKIRPVVVFVKALASAIAIGTGASVGREGPIVQVGSALGSVVGQWFKQNEARIKNLIACGAAAGIAGVFNAPIAGVMFAMEVILRDFGARALSSVVIAAVTSSIISRIYLGDAPAFIAPAYSLLSPYELLLYFVLGIVSGLVALLFIFVLHKSEDVFETWQFPNWLKPACGALVLGCIGFFFPQVFGTGFETIEQALHGSLELQLLAMLILLKIAATSLTLGSGSSGGVFAPALFIGAVTGGAFGRLFFNRLPFDVALPGAYAIVGMASVFAGAAHAPVTAILIVFEMTGDYKLILPLMVSTVVATAVSQVLNRESIYTMKLKRSGIDVGALEETRMFGGITVQDAMDRDFELISMGVPMRELAEKVSKHRNKSYFVVDQNNVLSGEIVLDDLEGLLQDISLTAVVADDLTRPVTITCYPDDPLSNIARVLLAENLPSVVVVDHFDDSKVVGVLRRENVFKAFAQAASRREELIQRTQKQQKVEAGELNEIDFTISKEPQLVGSQIKHLGLPEGVVLTSIRRSHKKLAPIGGTVLRSGDQVTAVFSREQSKVFGLWLEKHGLKARFQ